MFYLRFDAVVIFPGDRRVAQNLESGPIGLASLLFRTLILGLLYRLTSRRRAAIICPR